MTDAAGDRKFMLFWDIRSGETRYRWRLRGENSETLAFSEGSYTNKPDCESAIDFMRMEYPEVPVMDPAGPRS